MPDTTLTTHAQPIERRLIHEGVAGAANAKYDIMIRLSFVSV